MYVWIVVQPMFLNRKTLNKCCHWLLLILFTIYLLCVNLSLNFHRHWLYFFPSFFSPINPYVQFLKVYGIFHIKYHFFYLLIAFLTAAAERQRSISTSHRNLSRPQSSNVANDTNDKQRSFTASSRKVNQMRIAYA